MQNIWNLKGRQKERHRRRAEIAVLLLGSDAEDYILDIGCAEGYITKSLRPAGFVVGLDRSLPYLLLA